MRLLQNQRNDLEHAIYSPLPLPWGQSPQVFQQLSIHTLSAQTCNSLTHAITMNATLPLLALAWSFVFPLPAATNDTLSTLEIAAQYGAEHQALACKQPATKEDVAALRSEIAELESKVSALGNVSFGMIDALRETWRIPHFVSLNPEERASTAASTGAGLFFFELEDMMPYLDGYKIRIKIGNPNSVGFSESKLEVTWPQPQSTNSAITEPEARLSKTNRVHQYLEAGHWTPTEFTVAPATIKEARKIRVGLTPGMVHLQSKKEPHD